MLHETLFWNRKEVNKRKNMPKNWRANRLSSNKYGVCRKFTSLKTSKKNRNEKCEKFVWLHRHHYHHLKNILCFMLFILNVSGIGIGTQIQRTPTLNLNWNSENLNESTWKRHSKVSTLWLWMVNGEFWMVPGASRLEHYILNFHSFWSFNEFRMSIINTF